MPTSNADDESHAHDNGHDHRVTSTRKLALVAGINLVGFLAEAAGGLLFGSVALLSDAVHMLFDALAYVMAFAAAAVAERYEVSGEWSFGFHRLEPLSAFLNGVLLFPMVGYILYESYQRFLNPVDIGTGPTMAIAVGGLLVNLGSVYVLQGGEMSLNEKGAYYHLLGDAGGSIAVIVSTAVVRVTGLRIVDPVTAVLIAIVIVWSAVKLLIGSGEIFLHANPLPLDETQAELAAIEGVDEIVDLHSWQICSEITIASVHLQSSVDSLEQAKHLTHTVHDTLDEFGVNHATVELCLGDDCYDEHLHSHFH